MGFNFDQNERREYKTPAFTLKKDKRVRIVQRTHPFKQEVINKNNIKFLKSIGYKVKHV